MRRPQIPLPNTNTKRQESERRTTHTETQTHAYTPLIHTLPVALCVILFFFPSSSERAALRVNEPLSFLITFLLPSYYLFLSTYSSSLSNRSRPVHSPQHWPKKPSFFENLGSDNNYSTMAPSNVDVDRHPVSPEPTAVSDSDSVAIEDQERSSKNKDLHQDRHQDKNPFAPPNRSSHSSDEHSTMERLHVVLEENERLRQELERSYRRVKNLRREKNLLVDRVYELERLHFDFDSDSLSSLSSDSEASDSSVLEEARSKRTSPSRASVKVNGSKSVRGTPSTAATIVNAQHPKKTAVKSLAAKETKAQATPSTPSTITNVGSATQKPKRIHQTNKLRMGLAKVRKVQLLEKDEAGNVKLPVTVGIITIQSIGDVVYDREAFHNDRYIFPVGYKMSRSYNSMIDLNNQTTYTCSVIDDGEAPKFQIDAEDQPGKPIIAGTATGAWTHVVKAANAIRKRDHSNSASGPDYFGFSNATIAKMIQDLPNVDKCQSYIMQRFEEPSASTASSAKTAGGEKRKMSARSSTPKAGGDHNEEEGDHDAGEDDNEDAYASLGTPGKKKARVSSPKTRHASFDAPTAAMAKENVRASDTSIEHHETIDDGDESDETQSDFDPEDRRPLSPKLEAGLVHSIAASGHSQSPIVVTASGDSEMIDIEEHDSEVDVGMDESASSVQDPLAQPPAAPGIPADGQDRATDVAST